ncbi:MAG: hypothetical protein II404_00700 [Prevotella sp.]|nr:hypothetical protein [Prevotella sp.]
MTAQRTCARLRYTENSEWTRKYANLTINKNFYAKSDKSQKLFVTLPQIIIIMISTLPPQTNEISTVDALWVLIQGQTKAVRKALTERLLAEQDKTKVQKAMVKDSLTRAFDELHSGKVHHDARKLFAE